MTTPGRRRREIDDEIRHHVRECAELLVEEGWDPEEARREAERRFGDVEAWREELEEIDGEGAWLAALREGLRTLATNVRYALRALFLNPGFSAAVVLTLGLGVGVAASVFPVVDAAMLRPLAYDDAERWVEVFSRNEEGRTSQGQMRDRWEAWQEAGSRIFDGWVGFYRLSGVRAGDGGAGEPVSIVGTTPGTTSLLGIPLLRGRAFTAADAEAGAPAVALLGRHYWERLGGDPGIIGSTLELDTGPVTVVGVLKGTVKFPYFGPAPDVWLPIRADFSLAGREIPALMGAWARLAPGVTVEAAQERADVLAEALLEERPREGGWAVELRALGSFGVNDDTRRALWILAGTVGLILLIAVVNGVNLLLVRATGRAREFAIRVAMGASRAQLGLQLLVEGVVLGVVGGGAAVVLALLSMEAVEGLLPRTLTFFSHHAVSVGPRTLTFAFGAALLAGILLGLVPGVELARARPALSRSRGSDEPPGLRRSRRLLVVGQVALSTVLLFGAGLFLRSFGTLLQVDPGYDHERLARAQIQLLEGRYPEGEKTALLRRIEERLEAQPGVEAVSIAGGSMLLFGVRLEPEGGPVPAEQPDLVPARQVGPDHIETMGLELVAGRGFQESDAGRDELVVIDRDLALHLWGTEAVAGRRFRVGEERPWRTVLGVVEELRILGRDQREAPYHMLRQGSLEGSSYFRVDARTAGDPASLLPVIRRTIGELDPLIPIHELRTGPQELAHQESELRFLVTLMAILAGVATLLATVGLYGVLAYTVGRRRRELGVRLALGARVRGLLTMVLREGLALAAVGVGLGLAGALVAARLAEALLYEVAPRDPVTALATAVLFLAVATAASLVPARRATRVDPVESLRAE